MDDLAIKPKKFLKINIEMYSHESSLVEYDRSNRSTKSVLDLNRVFFRTFQQKMCLIDFIFILDLIGSVENGIESKLFRIS